MHESVLYKIADLRCSKVHFSIMNQIRDEISQMLRGLSAKVNFVRFQYDLPLSILNFRMSYNLNRTSVDFRARIWGKKNNSMMSMSTCKYRIWVIRAFFFKIERGKKKQPERVYWISPPEKWRHFDAMSNVPEEFPVRCYYFVIEYSFHPMHTFAKQSSPSLYPIVTNNRLYFTTNYLIPDTFMNKSEIFIVFHITLYFRMYKMEKKKMLVHNNYNQRTVLNSWSTLRIGIIMRIKVNAEICGYRSRICIHIFLSSFFHSFFAHVSNNNA